MLDQRNVRQWWQNNFFTCLVIACLLLYFFSYLTDSHGPPIRADGVGYYSYLPSLFIHGDLSFEGVANSQFDGEMPSWTGITRQTPDTNYVNKYNMGVALMMMPFFLIGHVVTWLMSSPPNGFDWWKLSYPADGFSLFYQHAAGLAGLCYFLAALYILVRELEQVCSRNVARLTVLVLMLGTNLLNYGTGETVFATSYSFFLFCLYLRLVRHWYMKATWRRTVGLGLVAGAICLVRSNNLLFVTVVLALWGVGSTKDLRGRLREWLEHRRYLAAIALTIVLCFMPQLIYWKYAAGRFLFYSYGHEGFHFGSPRILEVLFSLNRGVFFWTPLLLLPLLFSLVTSGNAKDYRWAFLIYFIAQLYVVASWHQWYWGGSFGHRAFIEGYSLAAFPLAACFGFVKERKLRWPVAIFCVACIVWTLFTMKLYYTRELSYYGLDRQALFDIFWLRKEMVLRWLM